MRFVIDENNAGRSVKQFLAAIGVSAGLSSKLKAKEQGILQNGTCVTVRSVLAAGDVLDLAIEDDAPAEKLIPMPFLPEFLFENDDLAVINKPPFLPTHPSHGHFSDTLANGLAYHYSKAPCFRPRFINRLDRNTSGAVLVAKHALSASILSKSMVAGNIHKGYLALAKGRLTEKVTLRTGIRRKEESIIFREVCDLPLGDEAITEIIPLDFSADLTLIKLIPHTGRTHQLRVHMAHLDHPLLGDDLYGGTDPRMARHALHAAYLAFPLSGSGEIIRLSAPLPADMCDLILKEFGEEGMILAKTAFSDL